MTHPLEYEITYRLSAAQCNAQRELAPAQLVQYLIEAATAHADSLDFGFARLQQLGILWVLSRITFRMKRYPRLFEKFAITTWVGGYNRHFSERNYEVTDEGGEPIGYAHTVWMAIDLNTRRPADLTAVGDIQSHIAPRECPIGKVSVIRCPENILESHTYRFHVSDIDCNRHVNSARYVELVLNQLPLEEYDRSMLRQFEIAYKQEAHFGDTARVDSTYSGGVLTTGITVDGRTVCLSRATMVARGDD